MTVSAELHLRAICRNAHNRNNVHRRRCSFSEKGFILKRVLFNQHFQMNPDTVHFSFQCLLAKNYFLLFSLVWHLCLFFSIFHIVFANIASVETRVHKNLSICIWKKRASENTFLILHTVIDSTFNSIWNFVMQNHANFFLPWSIKVKVWQIENLYFFELSLRLYPGTEYCF